MSEADHPEIRSSLVRDAVDHVVARARKAPRQVPASLQKVMRFKKLPAPALVQVERALETEDEFRTAMAAGATDRSVGQAGMLWLNRPEGWEARFDSLVNQEVRRQEALDAMRAEDNHDRRESQAQAALGEVEQARSELETQVAALQADLDTARATLREQVKQISELNQKLAAAQEERAEAIRQLKHQEQLLARSVEQRRALEAAARGPAPEPVIEEPEPEPVATPPAAARPKRRVPIALPGGIWDDTPEAAAHIFAHPDVLVLVDGYNVTISAWPQLTISDQRDRLVKVAGSVAARSKATVKLVWDGADDVGTSMSAAVPAGVQVHFTSGSQEADDWIIEYCADAPISQPLAVVSDDRRVRDGVRTYGVNLLSRNQMLDYAHGNR